MSWKWTIRRDSFRNLPGTRNVCFACLGKGFLHVSGDGLHASIWTGCSADKTSMIRWIFRNLPIRFHFLCQPITIDQITDQPVKPLKTAQWSPKKKCLIPFLAKDQTGQVKYPSCDKGRAHIMSWSMANPVLGLLRPVFELQPKKSKTVPNPSVSQAT